MNCKKCGSEFEQGALLFSPPNKKGKCKKTYLCKNCYDTIVQSIIKYDPISSLNEYVATTGMPIQYDESK